MSRKRGVIGAIITFTQICVLALVVTLSHNGAGAGATGSIAVTGTVTNQSGAGIANVSISADAPSSSTVEFGPTTTASDGSYTLYVDAGSYDFHFDPPSGSGLSPIIDSNITIFSDQTINIQLAPITHTFSGTVTDQNNNPINSLFVQAYGVAGGVTDASGFFSGTGSGASFVSFSTNNVYGNQLLHGLAFGASGLTVDLTNSDVTQNFTLHIAKLSVITKDSSGNLAAAGLYISSIVGNTTVSSNGNDYMASVSGNALADINGDTSTTGITIINLPQNAVIGQGKICATFADGAFVCNSSQINADGDVSVELDAPITHTISSTVTDQNGNPFNGLIVSVDGVAAGETDSSGYFSSTGSGTGPMSFTTNNVYGNQLLHGLRLGASGLTVDLTNSDVSQDFTLHTVKLSVITKDASGNLVPAGLYISSVVGNTTVSANGADYPATVSGSPAVDINADTSTTGITVITLPQGVSIGSSRLGAYFADGAAVWNSSQIDISGDMSILLQEVPIPSAPTNLSTSAPTQNPALTWTASPGADSYNVYRDGTIYAFSSTASYTDTNAPEGTHTYYVTAVNAGGESGHSNSVSLYVNHTSPTTTASLSPSPYAQDNTYPDPVTVTLSASPASSNVSITNTYYTIDNGSQQTYSSPFAVSGSGNHTITYWSVDNSGVQETAKSTPLTIHTNLPPSVSILSVGTTFNEGDTYSATGSFSDWDSSSWTATVDYGDGSGVQPLTLSGNSFSLSHVYKDEGTYTVNVSVTDNQGATGSSTATVTVNNAPFTVSAITAPLSPVQLPVGSTSVNVSASATFTDPGVLDTHTAVWDWGDNTTSTGTVIESNGSGSVSDTHAYTADGIYLITLTVTDDDGVSVSQQFQWVAVYTPTNASLFSGTNFFTSPAGADPANPSLSGKTTFGINVSYNHTGQPTGTAKLNFLNDNLAFTSTAISLLVNASGKATLRGSGTITGRTGTYTFLATGIDSQSNGGTGLIRFQIKNSSGTVVYDSQSGASDTANPTAVVTGQVIVNH
jgi:PKD domain/Carboxypeptidase regulatory-like domain